MKSRALPQSSEEGVAEDFFDSGVPEAAPPSPELVDDGLVDLRA